MDGAFELNSEKMIFSVVGKKKEIHGNSVSFSVTEKEIAIGGECVHNATVTCLGNKHNIIVEREVDGEKLQFVCVYTPDTSTRETGLVDKEFFSLNLGDGVVELTQGKRELEVNNKRYSDEQDAGTIELRVTDVFPWGKNIRILDLFRKLKEERMPVILPQHLLSIDDEYALSCKACQIDRNQRLNYARKITSDRYGTQQPGNHVCGGGGICSSDEEESPFSPKAVHDVLDTVDDHARKGKMVCIWCKKNTLTECNCLDTPLQKKRKITSEIQ